MNEWKELGKNGQRGFEYGEFWLARASFFLFCVLFFVVVLLHIFSLLHRRRSQRRHMEERAFFGKEFHSSLSFFGILVPLGEFVSIKIESSLLFFWIAENRWQRLSSIHLRCSAYHNSRLSWDRSNSDRWSTLIFDWNISLKIPYVFKSICVSLRGAD